MLWLAWLRACQQLEPLSANDELAQPFKPQYFITNFGINNLLFISQHIIFRMQLNTYENVP